MIQDLVGWLMSASDLKLLLVFLVVSCGTFGYIVWKYLPMPRRLKEGENGDEPAQLSRAWLDKQEQRGTELHKLAGKVHNIELKEGKWDNAATLVDAHTIEIGMLRSRIEQVATRTHEHAAAVGTVPLLVDQVDSLSDRVEAHVQESAVHSEKLTEVRVSVGEVKARVDGVAADVGQMRRTLERLEDRLLSEPKRRSTDRG